MLLLLSAAFMNGDTWEENQDLNNFYSCGILRHFSTGCTNAPHDFVNVFNIGPYSTTYNAELIQIAFACHARKLFIRFYHPGNSWGNWITII